VHRAPRPLASAARRRAPRPASLGQRRPSIFPSSLWPSVMMVASLRTSCMNRATLEVVPPADDCLGGALLGDALKIHLHGCLVLEVVHTAEGRHPVAHLIGTTHGRDHLLEHRESRHGSMSSYLNAKPQGVSDLARSGW
jgi:hypothetical protein